MTSNEKELRAYAEKFFEEIFADHNDLLFVPDNSFKDDSDSAEPEFYGRVVLDLEDAFFNRDYEFHFCTTISNVPAFYVGDQGDTNELTELNIWKYLYYWHAVPDPYHENAEV